MNQIDIAEFILNNKDQYKDIIRAEYDRCLKDLDIPNDISKYMYKAVSNAFIFEEVMKHFQINYEETVCFLTEATLEKLLTKEWYEQTN